MEITQTNGERRLELQVRRRGKVDQLLRQALGCSAAVVRTAKGWPDGILLDGRHVRTDQWAEPGQRLSILISDRTDGDLAAAPGPVDIVYQDADLLIINKAPGVAVHPSPGHYDDTLGNFLTWHFRGQDVPFRFRPVNRLDRGTSGLMAAARHAYAQERMKGQLHTGDFQREYLAVCQGRPEEDRGTVDQPIGREEGSVLRRQVRPDGARAVTHYRVLWSGGGRSLLRLKLETGRTHQIRVHMAWLGHPLVGDFLYGEEGPLRRTALHAWKLALTHPLTGQSLSWTAPLPGDMAALLPEDVAGRLG